MSDSEESIEDSDEDIPLQYANKDSDEDDDGSMGGDLDEEADGVTETESDEDDDSDMDSADGDRQPDEVKFDEDRDAPKPICLGDTDVAALTFHPESDRIALGTLDGDIMIYKYALEGDQQEGNKELKKISGHSKTCRGLKYTPDGSHLMSISKDKSWKLFDAGTLQVVREIQKAHKSSLYSLAYIDEWLCATGDEDGEIRLWDHRTPKMEPVQTYKESEDYIADLLIETEKKKILLSASAEGTLTALDVRRKKLLMQSEQFDQEFLSLALIKGNRVVAGTSAGSFEIFNWNEFGYIVNAMCSKSKASIDSIACLDGTIVCYGCGDGNVRASSLFPNKPLGIIGKHCDFPIVSVDLCKDRKYLASTSADQKVKFWNVEELVNKAEDTKKVPKGQDLKLALNTKRNNFFSGLVDE